MAEVDDDATSDEVLDALYEELPPGLCYHCSVIDIGDFEMDGDPHRVDFGE